LKDAMAESEDGSDPLRDRIIDAALALAEEDAGWYDLRLHIVARRLDVPLSAVLVRFRDTDAIADAWFDRSLHTMLHEPGPGFGTQPPSGRVHAVLTRWFEAQAAHRRVVGDMIGAKLHPSHPHHWVPMVFSLSRLIHWVLDAARLDTRGLPRQAEEVGLTLVFLGALRVWLNDSSPGQRRTRAFLRRNLQWLDRLPPRSAARGERTATAPRWRPARPAG
jgi:AcrR family transcriptional regulator